MKVNLPGLSPIGPNECNLTHRGEGIQVDWIWDATYREGWGAWTEAGFKGDSWSDREYYTVQPEELFTTAPSPIQPSVRSPFVNGRMWVECGWGYDEEGVLVAFAQAMGLDGQDRMYPGRDNLWDCRAVDLPNDEEELPLVLDELTRDCYDAVMERWGLPGEEEV